LDAQLRDVESFDQMVSAFLEEYQEYLIPHAPASQPFSGRLMLASS